MGNQAPETCYITGLPTQIILNEVDAIEYSVILNGKKHEFHFSEDIDWGLKLISENIHVLRAMRLNDEWPLEEDTYIKEDLLKRIIEKVDYPKEFEEKENYLLEFLYKSGGREYRELEIEIDQYHLAYSKNTEEFVRIIKGLNDKGYIKLNEPHKIIPTNNLSFKLKLELTENGRKIPSTKIAKDGSRTYSFPTSEKPKVLLISLNNPSEKKFIERLSETLLSNDFAVTSSFVNGGFIDNAIHAITAGQYDFLLFLKSNASANDNSMNSVLGSAIAMNNSRGFNDRNLFIAEINTEPIKDIRYYVPTFDIRIIPIRQKLVKLLADAWLVQKGKQSESTPENIQKNEIPTSENNVNYKFPKINLSEYEIKWLRIIFELFLKNEQSELYFIWAKHSDDYPENFNPSDIDNRLSRSDSITLLGIWHIDPNSHFIDGCHQVIINTQELLKTSDKEPNKGIRISSTELKDRIPNLSAKDIYLIFNLIDDLGNFRNGSSSSGNFNDESFECSIDVNTREVINSYLDYKGLEDLVTRFFNQYDSSNTNSKRVNLPPAIISTPKNKFIVTEPELDGVLNVKEISEEFATIISELPENEKGNMVGVFGKWGRGKSFFIKYIKLYFKNSKSEEFHFVNFNAWKYQNVPSLWAYLYEQFASEYFREENHDETGQKKRWHQKTSIWIKRKWKKIYKIFRLNIRKHGWFSFIRFVLLCIYLVVSIYWAFYQTDKLLEYLIGGTSFFSLLYLLKETFVKHHLYAQEIFKKYTSHKGFKELLGNQAEVQKEIKMLVKEWLRSSSKRILLLVDDIDRCSEERIIEIIDALRIMLDDEDLSKKIIVIAAIDEDMLRRAIEIKYQKLFSKNSNSESYNLAKEYMDKLFVLGLKLGSLTEIDRVDILKRITRNKISDIRAETIKRTEKIASDEPGPAFDRQIPDEKEINSNTEQASETANKGFQFKQFNSKNKEPEIVTESKKEFEISSDEISLLNNILKEYHEATPRHIRIFYYRYLLARNLLDNAFRTLLHEEWNLSDKNILPTLIFKFSTKPDLLKNLPKSIQNLKPNFPNKIDNVTYQINETILLEMLKVVEMVVPY